MQATNKRRTAHGATETAMSTATRDHVLVQSSKYETYTMEETKKETKRKRERAGRTMEETKRRKKGRENQGSE